VKILLSLSLLLVGTSLSANGGGMTSDIVEEIQVNKSLDETWAAWTTNKALEQWLTAKANVEPKLGGLYELFWEPEKPNQNSTIGCHITAFVPKKLIAFEWKGPVQFADIMNSNPPATWVVVTFESTSINSTLINFRHSGWGTGEKWTEARQWQRNVWLGAFEELKK
jgi:uncharacterized protein YndB with AHSA1/START domain